MVRWLRWIFSYILLLNWQSTNIRLTANNSWNIGILQIRLHIDTHIRHRKIPPRTNYMNSLRSVSCTGKHVKEAHCWLQQRKCETKKSHWLLSTVVCFNAARLLRFLSVWPANRVHFAQRCNAVRVCRAQTTSHNSWETMWAYAKINKRLGSTYEK